MTTQQIDEERFDPMTEAHIRQHRQEAAKRPASELVPLNQMVVRGIATISPHTFAEEVVEGEVALPTCMECGGAGYYKKLVPLRHPDFGALFPCRCKLAERAERRAGEVAQILARLQDGLGFLADAQLADFDLDRPLDPTVEWCGVQADLETQRTTLTACLTEAERYLADPQGGVFLCGPNGAGKTMLAAAILNTLIAGGTTGAAYESAPKLLRFIQSGFKDHSADERLDAILDVELLLLDDLGAEGKGGWNEQTLFEILDTRYKQGRRTIITANVRRRDLSKRLASRIADMVSAEIWLVVSDLREIRLRERRRLRERSA